MKKHAFVIICICTFICYWTAAQTLSPLQDRTVATTYSPVYDTRAWVFNAGAPVRSTPLVKNGLVFFGTAKGDFFAINKKSGQVKWKVHTGAAIHSTASASEGIIFFADNLQCVYAVDENTGRLIWKFLMGTKIAYPWRFDYYYSSPCLFQSAIFIGGDDGYLYRLDQRTGRLLWKFHAKGLVRSTPVIYKQTVLFGDTEATFYSLDTRTGKKQWEFKVMGDSVDNTKYGYDKRVNCCLVAGMPVCIA